MKVMDDFIFKVIIFDGYLNPNNNSIDDLLYLENVKNKYKNMFVNHFKLCIEELNNIFDYLKYRFESDLSFTVYKDEGPRKTIVFDNFVFRTIINNNELDFYTKLKEKPSENLEKVIEIINFQHVSIVLTEKYNICTKSFIEDNNLLELYIKDITNAKNQMEKLGYYHNDISIDNSVYTKINEKFRFILVDYNIINKTNKNDNHVHRNYINYFI